MMESQNIKKWLGEWYELLGESSIPPFETPDDLAGVLADFRHNPEILLKAFKSIPSGDEIHKRIKVCVESERSEKGLYLIPKPIKATDDEIMKLVQDSLQRGCECCGIDIPNYPINIIRREMSSGESSQAAPLIEELGDLFIEYTFDERGIECEAMYFLGEALYTLAASFELRGYCLTPLCPDVVKEINPYEPQIELWLRGAHAVVRWNNDSEDLWIDVFVDERV